MISMFREPPQRRIENMCGKFGARLMKSEKDDGRGEKRAPRGMVFLNICQCMEQGNIVMLWGFYCVIFLFFITAVCMETKRVKALKNLMENSLSASVLAASLYDRDLLMDEKRVEITDISGSYDVFKKCLKKNMDLFEDYSFKEGALGEGKVTVECFTVYNVYEDRVLCTSWDKTGKMAQRVCEPMKAYSPDGKRIENTSVYGEISLNVTLFGGEKTVAVSKRLADLVCEESEIDKDEGD